MAESNGAARARIAPTLTGEDLAEMLAMADFCISCGGSLHFSKPEPGGVMERLIGLKLIQRKKPPREINGAKVGISSNGYVHSLTTLGWLTLLTRAEQEMAHLLPAEAPHEGDE